MADVDQVKQQLADLEELAGTISTQFDEVVTKIDGLQAQIEQGQAVTEADLQELHDAAQRVKDTLAQVDMKQDEELAEGQNPDFPNDPVAPIEEDPA